jgi:hypothetical protein
MKKKKYIAPTIFGIRLDNQISLALESTPPFGPDETYISPEFFKNNTIQNSAYLA